MIPSFRDFNNDCLGSSLSLPAHGKGGARATSFLAAHFAKQNTNSVGAKREGAAEGGCEGNSAASERKIEASPAACIVRGRSQQKSFLFLLEEKIPRAQKENAEKTFLLAGERQRAAAGRLPLSGSVSRSKKVRAKCIITAPKLTLSEVIAPLAVRAADGSLRKAKSAFIFAVKSQSSLN